MTQKVFCKAEILRVLLPTCCVATAKIKMAVLLNNAKTNTETFKTCNAHSQVKNHTLFCPFLEYRAVSQKKTSLKYEQRKH